MSLARRALSIGLLILVWWSGTSAADPITIEFGITGAANDPNNRFRVGGGTFSFDSTVATPNTVLFDVEGLGVVSSIYFPWDGTVWTGSNADVYFLSFDSAANLVGWGLGGLPAEPGGMSTEDFPDVRVDWGFVSFPGSFRYTNATSPLPDGFGIFEGDMRGWVIVTEPVPEPASLALVGSGLVLCASRLCGSRRRRTAS